MPLSKMVLIPFERYKRLVDEPKEEDTSREEVDVETNSPLQQQGKGIKGPSLDSQQDSLPPPPPPGDPDTPSSDSVVDKEQTGSQKSWLDIWRPLPQASK